MVDDDAVQILIASLGRISDQITTLPAVCAKLESVVGTTVDLEHRLREVTAELRTRDDAQSKMIDDLRARMHEASTDIKGLSSRIGDLQTSITELKSELGRRVTALEAQVKATFDTQLRLGERVRNLEIASGNPELSEHLRQFAVIKRDVELLPEMRLQLKDILEFLPWMKVAKWALITGGGVVVVWLVKVFIELVARSGVLP